MEIVIETGTGTNPLANSYVTALEANEFLLDRALIDDSVEDDIPALLLRAMDFLAYIEYTGIRTSQEQPLPFPRRGVIMQDDIRLQSDVIPVRLKQAQMWLVNYLLNDANIGEAPEDQVTRERVDVIEVYYSDSKNRESVQLHELPNVAMCLRIFTRQREYDTGGGQIGRA